MSITQAIGLTVLPHAYPLFGQLVLGWNKEVRNWSDKLKKPSWDPPKWIFAPVWTTLYTSMGYASFLVLRDGVGQNRKLALGLYGSQLALNWIWPPLFFKHQKLGLASAELFLLTANVAACVWAFHPINKNAAYLMIPYLAWISFASLLNFTLWRLNRNKSD